MDLTQIVINDLFSMVAYAFTENDPSLIVSDFVRTFYPEGQSTTQKLPETAVNAEIQDGFKSFDTFGGVGGQRPDT